MFTYSLLHISLAGPIQVIHDLLQTLQRFPHLIFAPLRDHCSAQRLNTQTHTNPLQFRQRVYSVRWNQNMFALSLPLSYQQSPFGHLCLGWSEPLLSLPEHRDPASGHQLSSGPDKTQTEQLSRRFYSIYNPLFWTCICFTHTWMINQKTLHLW